jgi:hypothetical protein
MTWRPARRDGGRDSDLFMLSADGKKMLVGKDGTY